MDDYVASQNDWRTHVADPTIANPNLHTDDVDKRGKFYTDQESWISGACATRSPTRTNAWHGIRSRASICGR